MSYMKEFAMRIAAYIFSMQLSDKQILEIVAVESDTKNRAAQRLPIGLLCGM